MKSFVAFVCRMGMLQRSARGRATGAQTRTCSSGRVQERVRCTALRRALWLGMLCVMLGRPAFAAAEAPRAGVLTLEILMQHFSTTRGVRAEFEERKQMALLQQPVVSRGVLYFVPPARMARHVREPLASSLIIEDDKLFFRDDLGSEEMSLAERPEARELVGHFLVLFQGNLPALRKKYDIAFEAKAEQWQLTLRPRTFPAKSFIEFVQMVGNDRALLAMTLLETDGDRTDTLFSNVEVDRAFPTEELAKVFAAVPASAASKAVTGKP